MDRLTVEEPELADDVHKCIDCEYCKSFKIAGAFVKICSETKKEIKFPYKLIHCKLFDKAKKRKDLWLIE